MQNITTFDTSEHHIYVASYVVDRHGITHAFRGIVDTGAPATEFSDEFLASVGILQPDDLKRVELSSLEQTKKYARLTVQRIDCLGQVMENVTVKVSRFAEGWGIDALIGLDFFRRFEVTINYARGQIATVPMDIAS